MPLWAWIAIGAGIVAVVATGVALGVYGTRTAEERYLMRIVRSREGVEFVRLALGDTLSRLAEGSEAELHDFARDPESVERRALAEGAARARLLVDELDSTPLPKSIVPAAESLADAAYLIAQEASKVNPEHVGDAALDDLGSIDLDAVETYYAAAIAAVQQVCEVCGVDDSAVYGGGLYL